MNVFSVKLASTGKLQAKIRLHLISKLMDSRIVIY